LKLRVLNDLQLGTRDTGSIDEGLEILDWFLNLRHFHPDEQELGQVLVVEWP
jgi:hypothetical protein